VIPDTGEAVWFYQFSPHDLYDYDGVNENILLDLPITDKHARFLFILIAMGTSTHRSRDRRGLVGECFCPDYNEPRR